MHYRLEKYKRDKTYNILNKLFARGDLAHKFIAFGSTEIVREIRQSDKMSISDYNKPFSAVHVLHGERSYYFSANQSEQSAILRKLGGLLRGNVEYSFAHAISDIAGMVESKWLENTTRNLKYDAINPLPINKSKRQKLFRDYSCISVSAKRLRARLLATPNMPPEIVKDIKNIDAMHSAIALVWATQKGMHVMRSNIAYTLRCTGENNSMLNSLLREIDERIKAR